MLVHWVLLGFSSKHWHHFWTLSPYFKFLFRIYDIDNDGYISNGELFQVLKMMVGSNLKDTQLQQIVDKTILFADKVCKYQWTNISNKIGLKSRSSVKGRKWIKCSFFQFFVRIRMKTAKSISRSSAKSLVTRTSTRKWWLMFNFILVPLYGSS
jgi:hypothetical protein